MWEHGPWKERKRREAAENAQKGININHFHVSVMALVTSSTGTFHLGAMTAILGPQYFPPLLKQALRLCFQKSVFRQHLG